MQCLWRVVSHMHNLCITKVRDVNRAQFHGWMSSFQNQHELTWPREGKRKKEKGNPWLKEKKRPGIIEQSKKELFGPIEQAQIIPIQTAMKEIVPVGEPRRKDGWNVLFSMLKIPNDSWENQLSFCWCKRIICSRILLWNSCQPRFSDADWLDSQSFCWTGSKGLEEINYSRFLHYHFYTLTYNLL